MPASRDRSDARPSASYTRRYLHLFIFGGACTAAVQLALNRIDWLSKAAVDRLFAGAAGSPLTPAALMIAFALGAFALSLLARWAIFGAAARTECDLRAELLGKLHRLDSSFYRSMSPGDIMSRATNDVALVGRSLGGGAYTATNAALGFLSGLQVMLWISWRLTLVSVAVLPLFVIVVRAFSGPVTRHARSAQALLGRLGELTQSHFAGIRVVRSFVLEAFAEGRFAEAASRFLRASLAASRFTSAYLMVMSIVMAGSFLAVSWYGADFLRSGPRAGGLTQGDFFAFLIAWTRMVWQASDLTSLSLIMQRGFASRRRLREILERPSSLHQRTEATASPPDATDLRVEGLHYEVDGRRLLDDVGFEVPAGRSMAVVGRTGSGKSTLAALLARLLPPPPATIFLDGRDLLDFDTVGLRARVRYAQQEAFLFSTTIADNVAMGLAGAPPGGAPGREIETALGAAQIAAEVSAMTHGAQSPVGERGVQLSGGQRQRIALARALAEPAPLLVLDDPISAVDARTEAGILDALLRRSERSSLVLITNRLAAAARCDEILVLDEGRVVERGTHAELVGRAGVYRQLADQQQVEGELGSLGLVAADPAAAAPPAAGERDAAAQEPRAREALRLLGQLRPFLSGEWRAISLVLVTLAASIGAKLGRPLALGALIGAALAARPLMGTGAVLLVALVAAAAFEGAHAYLTERLSLRTMLRLRLRLFGFIGRLGLRTFDNVSVGQLVSRVVNDVELLGGVIGAGVVPAIAEVTSMLGILAMMLALDKRLSLVSITALPIVAVALALLATAARRAAREIGMKTAQLNSVFNEQVLGIGVIQAFGLEARLSERFDRVNREYLRAVTRLYGAHARLAATIALAQTLCYTMVLLWAWHLRADGAVIPFSVVLAFLVFVQQVFEPAAFLTERFATIQSALPAAERIFDVLDQTDAEPPSTAAAGPDIRAATEDIALEHVDFAYRPGQPVLKDVSLVARRGERIALVGPTGAGKSTITQLLLRLYDVDGGVVRVGGIDVRDWPRTALRHAFAVVPQEVMLFSGSTLDNIALGEAQPDRGRALAALDHLGLRERFERREGGLDARVDERALNFSAGERQLLSFARAVYRDAPILLLDEATASIDSTTEADLQRALDRLMRGRTTLVIAHRLSTIENADRIIVLQGGRIAETGTHGQLLAAGGLYARLHALQVRSIPQHA